MKLSTRVILLTVSVIVALGLGCSLAARFGITRAFERQALQDLAMNRSNVVAEVDALTKAARSTASLAAGRSDIAAALLATNLSALQRSTAEISAAANVDLLVIVHPNGTLADGGSTNSMPELHDFVASALSGKSWQGLAASSSRFMQCAAQPIHSDGRVVGVVVAGMDLLKEHGFVDKMRSRFEVECTIFTNDTRASTTIIRDGKRAIGTKMDNPAVIESVLKRGDVFESQNKILGRDYDTAYWPLTDSAGRRAGMLFIGQDRELIAHATNQVFRAVLLMVIAVGIVGVALSVALSHRIAGQIRAAILSTSAAAEHVKGGAAQVAEASQSLAEGASEQAASLEETSASLEEMSSMTHRNSGNAQQVTALARTARMAADAGANDMQAMSLAMQEIKQSSNDISKIISTIDEIAFQTNILALNAAVEAARAGEAGMGFAVVADEVRNLAQRSAEAAKETAHKIEDAISKTSNGVQISDKVVKQLQEITDQVRKLDQLAAEVADASREQSQGIDQMNTVVSQMDRVTQANAAHAEETASAAEELNAQADSIRNALRDLLHLIAGNSNEGTESQPTSGLDMGSRNQAESGTAPRASRRPPTKAGVAGNRASAPLAS